MRFRLALPLALGAALACSADSEDPQAALRKRGEQVYLNNCTACHARDPRVAGPIGPPVAGAAFALLEAKVLRNEYPPGHVPQRDTQAMIPLAHLEPDLPALAAFLSTEEAQ
jgi:mono/diheme cytochrome c family protein